jgi:pimeloyl-ACP methyl ester carboxylesterase
MTDKPNILLVHGAWGDASHWRHVIPPLHERGYRVFAVQNPLTSLSDDIDRTIKMAAAQDAPTLLVGHAYGCAVITGAGLTPNVVGLVYLAGPALDEGESLKSLWARRPQPEGAANIREDKYGFFVDRGREVSRDFLSRSRRPNRIASMGSYAEANCDALLRREVGDAGVESKAQLVSDLGQRPVDSYRDRKVDGGANQRKKDDYVADEPRFHCNSPR